MKELARTATYCSMFVASGAVSGILGPSLIYLAHLIHASVAEISVVFGARAIGNIVGALIASRMFDRWQGHHYLILMLILVIIGLVLVPFAVSLTMLVALFFLLGATEVSVNAGGNMMMLWLHKEKVGSYVTVLHLCYSLGCMIVPLVLVFSEWLGQDYGMGYWLLALYALIFPFLLWCQPSPRFQARESEMVPATKQKTTFIAFLIIIFLYVGFEITIGGWISTYGVLMGKDQNQAAVLVSWFYVGLSAGRLLSVPLLRWMALRHCLYGLIFISFIGSVLMYTATNISLVVIALLLGLGCSAIFPMLFAYASSIMSLNGKRAGLVFVCCGLGALVAPSLTGPIIGEFSVSAFPVVLIVLVLLIGISWRRFDKITT